ncbi:MAG: cation:proton antiporter [Rhodocyclaceae bacterium]|nr:cation:proton antiporter [Rhodocyclaceae bacterium]
MDWRDLEVTPFELSVLFFLQLAFILAVCRMVGWVAKHFGQPQVVAEMIAGVMMGPSLLGLFAPELQSYLFPPACKPILFAVSQVGLVLYMFLVGLEFDLDLIRDRVKSAAAVSLSGIFVPLLLGAMLGYYLINEGGFFAPNVVAWEAMFFTGASMAITAFPMLARIIYERGLAGTPQGTLALAAGSIDDGAAWCVLALVLASFTGNANIAILALGGGALYCLVVLSVGRRCLALLGRLTERAGGVTPTVLAVTLICTMLGAWYTDRIGIFAVFGAFIMGAAMPRGRFADEIQRQIGPLVTTFLLPLFFIYSGLNTRITLVDSVFLWLVVLGVLLAACVGKGVACWGAARLSGVPQRDALAIGSLMNARGLMELIILNIGLERGVVTPLMFTVMVIMAIITTLMATPLFEWVYRRFPAVADTRPAAASAALAPRAGAEPARAHAN